MAGYKQVTQVHAAAAAGGDRTQGTEPDYSSPSPTNALPVVDLAFPQDGHQVGSRPGP